MSAPASISRLKQWRKRVKAVDSDLYGLLSERLQGMIDFAADGILRDGPKDAMDIVKAAKERHLDRGGI